MSSQVEEEQMNCGLEWSEQGRWGGSDTGNKVGEMDRDQLSYGGQREECRL